MSERSPHTRCTMSDRPVVVLAVSASESYNTAIEDELRTRLGVTFTDRPAGRTGRRPAPGPRGRRHRPPGYCTGSHPAPGDRDRVPGPARGLPAPRRHPHSITRTMVVIATLTVATGQQGTDPLFGEPYCFGMRPDPVVDPRALRAARLAAGLTQHQLARVIGVAGGERISRWELGTSAPRPRMLQRLAEALGVGADSLLTPTDDLPDLRRLRATTGLSARELAERAYMAQPTLVRWESGRFTNIPSTAALEPLAAALGLSVDDVRRGLVHAKCKRDASDS